MSRTPTEEDKVVSQSYLDAWDQVGRAMRQGRSWSGYERNCCFLNTRGARFADVSAATGLDLIDDGRGVAVVDWDHDGDLDLWFTNRTGPRVRFLKNGAPEEGRFLSVRLVGDPARQCNRDAIGARLELDLKSSRYGPRRLVQTVYGGDGFASQSSKWVHFGLGESSQIERLTIRWPSRDQTNGDARHVEVFTGILPNGRYHIAQGTGSAQAVAQPRTIVLEPSIATVPRATDRARIRLSRSPVVSDFQFRQFDGEAISASELPQGPTLINLWATWCSPCLKELKELTRDQERLAAHNLTILALNVDCLETSPPPDPARAKKILEEIGFPFEAGIADPRMVDELNTLLNEILYPQRPLSLPMSFLLDDKQRLNAAYKGPLEISQLLRDVTTLGMTLQDMPDLFLPFPGRWSGGYFDPLIVARAYLDGGQGDDARNYLERFVRNDSGPPSEQETDSARARNERLAGVHFHLGEIAVTGDRIEQAIGHFQQALRFQPDLPRALTGLAWIYATHPDSKFRNGSRALQMALNACRATGFEVPGQVDTLAAAYAELGQFDQAIHTAEQAIQLAKEQSEKCRVDQEILARRDLYRQHRPYRATD